MEPFAFRTPVAIPEIGADAGDWIDYDPSDPASVYIIKEVSLRATLRAFSRVRALAAFDPSCGRGIVPQPRLRRLK